MSTSTRLPATLAMVVVAFLVALAPLFHAVCIAPLTAGAASANVSHVMADGTVMAMGSAAAGAASVDAAAASVDPSTPDDGTQLPAIGALTGDPLPLSGALGTVLLVAGIALSVILGLRQCRALARKLARPPVGETRVEPPRFALARAPAPVDLTALSISRT